MSDNNVVVGGFVMLFFCCGYPFIGFLFGVAVGMRRRKTGAGIAPVRLRKTGNFAIDD